MRAGDEFSRCAENLIPKSVRRAPNCEIRDSIAIIISRNRNVPRRTELVLKAILGVKVPVQEIGTASYSGWLVIPGVSVETARLITREENRPVMLDDTECRLLTLEHLAKENVARLCEIEAILTALKEVFSE